MHAAVTVDTAKNIALVIAAVIVVAALLTAKFVKSVTIKAITILILGALVLGAWTQRKSAEDCVNKYKNRPATVVGETNCKFFGVEVKLPDVRNLGG